MKNVHRGHIVEDRVRKSGQTIEQLSKKTGYSRSGIYKHFEREELDWKHIIKIGKAINYDFSNEFPELATYSTSMVMEDLSVYAAKDEKVHEAMVEIDKWKTKAYELSEELIKVKEMYYNLLIEQERKKK